MHQQFTESFKVQGYAGKQVRLEEAQGADNPFGPFSRMG